MQEFVEKCRMMWEQKRVVDSIKDTLKKESGQLEGMKKDILKIMEAADLQKQHLPDYGTISRTKKFSVKIPKTPDEKAALFEWIKTNKGGDVLAAMLSIPSPTLNSFYKEEMAIAVDEGNVNFKIEGIEVPEVYYQVGMRKG